MWTGLNVNELEEMIGDTHFRLRSIFYQESIECNRPSCTPRFPPSSEKERFGLTHTPIQIQLLFRDSHSSKQKIAKFSENSISKRFIQIRCDCISRPFSVRMHSTSSDCTIDTLIKPKRIVPRSRLFEENDFFVLPNKTDM